MNEKKYILGGGELKAFENDELMKFSGWLSTDDVDLTKEIVDAGAAKKHFDSYRKAGRLWLNHDPNKVIGVVSQCSLETKGLRADECQLSPGCKFSEEYVWPHIKSGAFSEFSIQFKSLKGRQDKKTGIYHHEEIMLIESSVVSIACNPNAVIDGLKSLIPSEDWYNANLDELYGLYQRRELKLPSEQRRNFFVDGTKDMKDFQDTAVVLPDFMDMTVLDEAPGLDQSGEALPMPSKARRDYADVCKAVHLAQSEARGSFVFRVGLPTAKGFKYDWDGVVMTLGSLLGAKGGAFFQEDEKAKAFDRIFKIYAVLGKALPEHDNTPLNELSDEALVSLKFADVDFKEAEGETISLNVVKNMTDSINNSLKNMSPEAKETVRKWVYGNIQMSFSVDAFGDEDMKFIHEVMSAYESWKTAEDERWTSMSFADYLKEQEKKNVVDEEADVDDAKEPTTEEEAVEPVTEEPNPVDAELAEAIKSFLANS